jgi:replicative DNA helicase
MSDFNQYESDSDSVLRQMPHSVQCEKAVLSVVFANPYKLSEVTDLNEDFFYLPQNRTFFLVLRDMITAGKPIEMIAFMQELLDEGKADSIGGAGYLADIATYQPSDSGFNHHVQVLREKYACRLAIKAASEITSVAFSAPESYELIQVTGNPVQAILDALTASKQAPDARQLGAEWWNQYQKLLKGEKKPMGWATGIEEMDHAFKGLHPGMMGIISARSSGGKSTLATQMMCGLASKELPVAYFPLEGSISAAYTRCIIQISMLRASCITSPLEYAQMQGRQMITEQEKNKITSALKRITDGGFHFDPPANRNIQTIVSAIRRAHRIHGIKVAFVDYVQLIKGESKLTKEQEIMGISNQLQELAANLEIFICVMSQENNDGETKHARAIEEDSDWTVSIVQGQDKKAADYKEHKHILITKDRHNSMAGTRLPLVLDRPFVRFVTKEITEEETKPKNRKDAGF